MRTLARILWKTYRFELVSVILALGLLAAAASVEAVRLEAAKPSPQCWDAAFAADEMGDDLGGSPACPSREPWFALNRETGQMLGAFTFLPLLAGALLGSVIVSREIEHRTTQLAWSLGPSRRRWLAERVLPMLAILLVLLLAVAVAADALEAGRSIGVDPRASLHEYGDRGIALVARGLGAFALALLLGALIGRQLPALIASATLALVLLVGINSAFPFGLEPRLLDEAARPRGSFEQDATLLVRQARQRADGTIVSIDEALAMAPKDADEETTHTWMLANFEKVEFRYVGDQLLEVELREAALLGALALLALAATFPVVERIEPS